VLSTYLGPPYDPDAEPLGVAPPATPLDARQFAAALAERSI
jgi:hypothetical protein